MNEDSPSNIPPRFRANKPSAYTPGLAPAPGALSPGPVDLSSSWETQQTYVFPSSLEHHWALSSTRRAITQEDTDGARVVNDSLSAHLSSINASGCERLFNYTCSTLNDNAQ